MIHAIYIYFIINAFMAGKRFVWDGLAFSIYLFLFGLVHHAVIKVLGFFYFIWLVILRKTWIVQLYRIWFTDYYKKAEPVLSMVRKQLKEGGYWERLFLKKYLDKYNHKIEEA